MNFDNKDVKKFALLNIWNILHILLHITRLICSRCICTIKLTTLNYVFCKTYCCYFILVCWE